LVADPKPLWVTPSKCSKVDVVFDWAGAHWGTQVMTVRDPDGRVFRLEAPIEE
jgi:hypothetical protein